MRLLQQGEASSKLPQYQTSDSSGMDLRAFLIEPFVLVPGARCLIPTGLEMAIPQGYEGQVRPRSGLAVKKGVTVLNAPGTIDADYRGEVKVCLINLGNEEVTILPGDRIAQLVFAAVVQADLSISVDDLPETTRGAGGFGHTGQR
jgi:dUTP diphosphatase